MTDTTDDATDVVVNDAASRALASIILQTTADMMTGDPAVIGEGLQQLSEDTGMVLDVCAAVIYATTTLAGAAGLTDAEVATMAIAYEDQAVTDNEGTGT